jgi:hypothetical protein
MRSSSVFVWLAVPAVIVAGNAPSAWADSACPEGRADSSCEELRPPNSERVPDLSSMKAPEAPAFMALGVSPSEIQRPATPTEFGMDLASGLAKGTSLSPLDNFAIQASPYWMRKHPNLTTADLDGQKAWAPLRNFSLSAGSATVKLDDGTATPVDAKRWALGARTTLFPGWQSQSAVDCQRVLVDVLDQTSGALAKARATFEAKWDGEHPRPVLVLPPGPDDRATQFNPNGKFDAAAFDKATVAWVATRDKLRAADGGAFVAWAKARDAARDEWLAGYQKARVEDPRVKSCITTLHDRVGFMAEVAGAYSMTLPGGDFQKLPSLRSRQQTYWLTLGYVLDRAPGDWNHALDISLLAVGRYQGEVPGQGDSIRRLDTGARVVVAWDRYGASVEGTYRRQTAAASIQNLSRFGFTIDYRLAGGAWATVTFGKDFGSPDSTPLIALANLQWNIGIDRQLSLDTTLTQKTPTESAP